MSFKRFFQLFICYFVSILIPYWLIQTLELTNNLAIVLLMTILGFIILCIPLTILTIKKNKR